MLSAAGPHSVPPDSTFAPRLVPGVGWGQSPRRVEKTRSLARAGTGWGQAPRLGSSRPRWLETRRPEPVKGTGGLPVRTGRRPRSTRSGQRRDSKWLSSWRTSPGPARVPTCGPGGVRRSDIFTGTKTCEGPNLDSEDRELLGNSVDRTLGRVQTRFRPRRSREVRARGGPDPRVETTTRTPTGTRWELLRNRRQRRPGRLSPTVPPLPGTGVMSMTMFTRTRARGRRRSVTASAEESWGGLRRCRSQLSKREGEGTMGGDSWSQVSRRALSGARLRHGFGPE
jgi:hypothetical protein